MPFPFTVANVMIEGGESITGVGAVSVAQASDSANVLVVQTNQAGDFSTYTLRLVDSSDDTKLPPNFDPILSSIDFSFKVACPSDFDCEQPRVCPPQPPASPSRSRA